MSWGKGNNTAGASSPNALNAHDTSATTGCCTSVHNGGSPHTGPGGILQKYVYRLHGL